MVGYGPEEARLRALAAGLGMGDAVMFLGRRRDVPEVLRALDVFAVSSDFEGSPLAVIEAMAAGVPVVSTRVGGIPDIVGGEGCAALVPPRDPGRLAQALLDLLGNPVRRAEMARRARARVAARYAFETVVERWQALYRELAEAAGISAAAAETAGRPSAGRSEG
jgi:glycosyltransferase involved in cell wall biosynthesis